MSPKHAPIDIIDKRTDPPTIHSNFTAIDPARSNVSKGLNNRSRYVWRKPVVCFPPSGPNSCKKWGAKHFNTRLLVSTTTIVSVDVIVWCPRMTRYPPFSRSLSPVQFYSIFPSSFFHGNAIETSSSRCSYVTQAEKVVWDARCLSTRRTRISPLSYSVGAWYFFYRRKGEGRERVIEKSVLITKHVLVYRFAFQ